MKKVISFLFWIFKLGLDKFKPYMSLFVGKLILFYSVKVVKGQINFLFISQITIRETQVFRKDMDRYHIVWYNYLINIFVSSVLI